MKVPSITLIFSLLFVSIFFTSCKKENKDPMTNGVMYADLALFKSDALGVIYNQQTNSIAYNQPDANGIYKIFISNYDGSGEVQLIFPDWATDRHQWAEEWDPSGEFLICYIEKTAYVSEPNHTRVSEDAIPGYGAYTDIWIVKRDGTMAWKMTDLPNNYKHGICHGAISKDGTLFAWTERIDAPDFLDPNMAIGAYVFKVANLNLGTTPSFSNIRTYQPGGFLAGGEVESISPDNKKMLIYSTFESKNILTTPIYSVDLETNEIVKVAEESFCQSPTYTPNGNKIVYMTGKDCDIFIGQLQGADWWVMNADGSQKRRLTFMNKNNHIHSVNKYRLAGSLSFVNDSTFLGGVMTQSFGLTGYTALVKF